MNFRDMINLVETGQQPDLASVVPPKLAGKIPPGELSEAYAILLRGHSLDNVQTIEPREPDEAMEAIAEALTTLARQFDSGSFSIYRAIEADMSIVSEMKEPTSLGIFWSFSEAYTAVGNISIEANAKPESVNWAETIVLNVDGVENEIRLNKGSPIYNVSIGSDDPDFDWDADFSTTHYA